MYEQVRELRSPARVHRLAVRQSGFHCSTESFVSQRLIGGCGKRIQGQLLPIIQALQRHCPSSSTRQTCPPLCLSAGSAGDRFGNGEEGDGAQTRHHPAEGKL